MKKVRANYTHKQKYNIPKKILHFPSDQGIVSEEDIISLFMGLVNLLKRNEQVKLEHHYEQYIKCLKKEIEILTHQSK